MEEKSVVHSFEQSPSIMNKNIILIFAIIIILGIGTGYFLSQNSGPSYTTQSTNGTVESDEIKAGQVFGSEDEKTFKDSAEGVMREGGIEGEGEFHLERPGGESQNVYMTSSTIDLSQFVGKKVKVWGQTNSAKKAGWLMDVGRLEVK